MLITRETALFIKGYETGAERRHGRWVLLPRGKPALTAYPDPKSGRAPWTIGWGHCGRGIGPNTTINLSMAEGFFQSDIAFFEQGVLRAINGGAPTTQGQFDALVSFAFNCGLDEDKDDKPEGLGDSTLLKLHRAGKVNDAADEFLKWTSGGMGGLVARRAEERAIYLS